MATERTIFIKTSDDTPLSSALVNQLAAASTSVAAQPLVLGDAPIYNIYLVNGDGTYDARSGNAGYTPRFALVVPGLAPTGGTFIIGYGSQSSGTVTSGKRYKISDFQAGDDFTNIGASANATGVIFTATGTTPTTWTNSSVLIEVSTDLAYNASAATIATALNLLATITTAGGVTVSGEIPAWLVEFSTAGSRTDLHADGALLTPDGQAAASEVQAGTSALKERQTVVLARQALAQNNALTPITNGWRGALDCATYGLHNYIGAEALKAASEGQVLEFELTDNATGKPATLCQVPVEVRNQGIRPGTFVPVPLDDFYTIVQSLAAFVQNQYAITGLTGGGATNLDGITTVGVTTALVAIRISSVINFYRLRAGTDAESSPDIIRPDDYDGSTNAKVWELQAVGLAAGTNFQISSGNIQILDDLDGVTWHTLRVNGGQLYTA